MTVKYNAEKMTRAENQRSFPMLIHVRREVNGSHMLYSISIASLRRNVDKI